MDSQSPSICVISLNALDINFLKDRFEENSISSSYWIKRDQTYDDNSYYEFEVKADKCLDVHEDPINHEEKLDYIPCHICEIEVPQQFYCEHRNSQKHEINVKIANLAVQRLHKHISSIHESNNNTKMSSVYFCPVCVITMDVIEKENHKNSIGHRNSLIVEKFLKDFLSIYSQDPYEDNENSKHSVSMAITKPSERRNDTKSVASNTQEKLKHMPVNRESYDEKSSIKKPKDENKQNIIRIGDYITVLRETYKSQSIQFKAVNESTLEIITTDGIVARVNAENFHGFKALTNRFMQCVVCKQVFDISKKQEHIMTEYHMKSVWCLPLENKDCVRYITDIWSHCVLCNVGVEDSSSHILSSEHLENITLSVISENKQYKNKALYSQLRNANSINETQLKDNNEISLEKANNMFLDMSTKNEEKSLVLPTQTNENVDTKLNSEQSKIENVQDKQFCSYCNIFISTKGFRKHSNTIKHNMNTLSDFHYFMNAIISTDGNFICRICEEKVTDNLEDIKQHTTMTNHVLIYNALLHKNGIVQINKQTFFCSLCNDVILIKNELLHINSKEHKMLCSDNDNETGDKSLSSVPSSEDVKISETKVEPASSYFFCNICSVNVPNTKQNIQIHIKGRPHIKNVQKLFNTKVNDNECNKVKTTAIDENKDEINSTISESDIKTPIKHYNLVKTSDLSILKCVVCDVFITNNEGNIATHVKGLNHSNNYNVIIKTNGIQINDNDIFCKTCSVHISHGNEIQHCNGKKHINNLSATQSS